MLRLEPSVACVRLGVFIAELQHVMCVLFRDPSECAALNPSVGTTESIGVFLLLCNNDLIRVWYTGVASRHQSCVQSQTSLCILILAPLLPNRSPTSSL